MVRRFGVFYHLSLLGLLLRRLRLEEHSAENIRRAAERGPVVYVLHTRSVMDWLALNRVLNNRRLPLAVFTTGLRSTWLKPIVDLVVEGWSALRVRLGQGKALDAIESGWFAEAVAGGMTSCVFLVHPELAPLWRQVTGRTPPDAVAALVKAQESCSRPIQAVPVVVVWQRAPESARTEATRFVMGSQDEPGPLQKLFAVAARTNRAIVQAGEPLDLRALLDRYQGESVARRARAARILLRRYLYRESHVIRGPRIRPHRWTRRLVTSSPEVRRLVTEEAQASGRSEAQVQAKVEQTLDRIAARMSFPYVQAADWVCRFLFNRIFSGVDIRDEDVERLRAAMRTGTPVLVPCHRSHIDYLLISWVLYTKDIVLPHIVAGDNLSFFPMGPIFRRLGAFFVKRSFKGDRIFPVVFERYLRQLVRDGFPIEFFIEGGRSRSGKLLPARHGVLGMLLDAAASGRSDREVTMLPVAISYEQIAEEASYARELAGASKQRENVGQMVKATRVVRKRFGKVYIRLGEPLTTAEVFDPLLRPWLDLDADRRREVLQHTGERLMYRIAEELVVLPSGLVAMALLAQSRRGVRLTVLTERAQRLDRLLRAQGASPAGSLSYGGWAVQEALRRFERGRLVSRLTDEEGDILQVVDDKRITLEYYKNGLIHFVVPVSLMAAAVRACRELPGLEPAELFRLFRTQVFLLRYEFTLDPEAPLEDLQQGALDAMVDYGALSRDEAGNLAVADKERVIELAELTRNFLESYLLVLRAARTLRSRDIPPEEFPHKVQEVGKGLLAVEEILRSEALSMANLSNAVKAFREEGLLDVRTGEGGLQFQEQAWRQYVDELSRLLS